MDDLKLDKLKIIDEDKKNITKISKSSQNNKRSTKYATILIHHLNSLYSDDWQYIFVNYDLNKDFLIKLHTQFENIKDFDISVPETDEYIAVILLDLKNLVSEKTAIEFCSLDLTCEEFSHRKFDGKIKDFNIHFKSNYNSRKKIKKISRILGKNKIINYLTNEHIIKQYSSSEEDSTSSSE